MSAEKASDQAKLKRLAKALSTFAGIPLYEAFDEASRRGGFRNYEEAKRLLETGAPVRFAARIDRSHLSSDTTCSVSFGPPVRCEFRASQPMCQAHECGSSRECSLCRNYVASTGGSSPAVG